ncbi:MAG: fimbrillin family protein [Bacteroidaceae bacterium]
MDEISGEEIPGYSPIFVSAKTDAPLLKSSLPKEMCKNFKVFAVKEKGGAWETVMNGYEVNYLDGIWSYVSGGQELKYWMLDADDYLFVAGAPVDSVLSMSRSEQTLHLENNTRGSVLASEPLKIERTSPDFAKTVNIFFGYAHCRVCVAFYHDKSAEVANITLTPETVITSAADVTYTYDWSTNPIGVTTALSNKATSNAALAFEDVSVTAKNAVPSTTYYYCVPDETNNPNWTIRLTVDGEWKEKQFVNTEPWERGKNYIYLFTLTNKTPKLVKVITQDADFFDCNDILPGGSFDDVIMTE